MSNPVLLGATEDNPQIWMLRGTIFWRAQALKTLPARKARWNTCVCSVRAWGLTSRVPHGKPGKDMVPVAPMKADKKRFLAFVEYQHVGNDA